MNSTSLTRTAIAAIGGLGVMLLGGCEPGPKQTSQTGYRGAGLDQIVDVRHMAKAGAIPPAPYPLPPDGGPTAGESYQNLKVLGGVSKERFDHLMAEISQWIAPPEQGCAYCHNPENMASDEKYTKVVARRMIQMTQNINSTWSTHVKQTGVTCYTCHGGNAVPINKWALAPAPAHPGSILGNRHSQNELSDAGGYTSLPLDVFADYLDGHQNIRVAGDTPLPAEMGTGTSVMETEKTYSLMIHISKALGVNCTYCHNTQSFRAWNLSRPQRAQAWYGIRMVRDINTTYISSLKPVFPDYRKGPMGDPYKVNCTTCHQGLSKPLGGVSMIAQAPALKGPIAYTKPETASAATTMPPALTDTAAKTTEK
jgi:photosynthetic reaction center cytochrome c subunit